MRLSSHCRMPSGLVSPRNEVALCHGSGGVVAPGLPSGGSLFPVWPPGATASGSVNGTTLSSQADLTLLLPLALVTRLWSFDTTAIMPIFERSVVTTAPRSLTTAAISAGLVPGANLRTVTFQGFPAAGVPTAGVFDIPTSTAAATIAAAQTFRISILPWCGNRCRHGNPLITVRGMDRPDLIRCPTVIGRLAGS